MKSQTGLSNAFRSCAVLISLTIQISSAAHGNQTSTPNIDHTSCAALTGDPWGLQLGQPEAVKLQDMDTVRAVAACRAELESDPDNPELNYYLGRALYADKDYPAAVPYLTTAAETGIASADIGLGIGKLFGRIPSDTGTSAHDHFSRAHERGHILAGYWLAYSRYRANKHSAFKLQYSDDVVRDLLKAGEAGYGPAWHLLAKAHSEYLGLETPSGDQWVDYEYLEKADQVGYLPASFELANRYFYEMFGGDYTGTGDRFSEERENALNKKELTLKMMNLYEKIVAQKRLQHHREKSAVRLAYLYLIFEGSELGNRERARDLICQELNGPTKELLSAAHRISLPDCSR